MHSRQIERSRNAHSKVSKWSRKEIQQKHCLFPNDINASACNVIEKPLGSLVGKLPVGNLNNGKFTSTYSLQADLLEEAMLLRKIGVQGIANVIPSTQIEADLLKEFRLMNEAQFGHYKIKFQEKLNGRGY